MDIFEYSEVNYPSRTVQQDEEEAAVSTAPANLDLPVTLWNAQLRAKLFPDGIVVGAVVVATTRASCALLNHAFPGKQVLGSLVLPEVPMRGLTLPHSLRNRTCTIYVVPGPSPALLVACQYDVAAERAHAVCTALLGEVCPEQVVVVGSLRAEAYRGAGDASQEALVFRLATAQQPSSSQPAGPHPVPTLPTGNVVGGLPAAILSYCQVRGMSGQLVVDVEMVPSLCAESVAPLASATAAVLSRAAATHPQPGGAHPAHAGCAAACSAVAAALTAPETLAAARRDVEAVTAAQTGALGAVYA
uniref:Proteasome assembly chaperone 1 n=1 Tax=Chlamydomonas leiostraca TaxID=1034604 RepID=A0A7S0RPI1_9CHLO|mmetsp:Transcript_27766/g.70780  ORF Transcript_27766/g.70780 Transcript_27766/m.70780 type:complete len:303 (+) Transcript_27766:10-918(+)